MESEEAVIQEIVTLELEAQQAIAELKSCLGPAATVSGLNSNIRSCLKQIESKLRVSFNS